MEKTKAIFEIDKMLWKDFKIATIQNESSASKEIRKFIIQYLKK